MSGATLPGVRLPMNSARYSDRNASGSRACSAASHSGSMVGLVAPFALIALYCAAMWALWVVVEALF